MIPAKNSAQRKEKRIMGIDENLLKRLWIKRYGNNPWARDCYGYWIYFYDHGRDCRKRTTPDGRLEDCGWEIDHILPEARGGSDYESNLEFVYHVCNEKKSDKTVYELANGKIYEVKSRPYKPGYGIYSRTLGRFIDWTSKN